MDLTDEVLDHQDALFAIAEHLIEVVVPKFDYGSNSISHLKATKLHLASIISDQALLYRFYKKNKFNIANAQTALLNHLTWRIQNNILAASSSSLSSEALGYAKDGLLRYHGQDKLGRPCAYLNLRKYNASVGKKFIEQLREYLIFALEVGRRCVVAVNDQIAHERERRE
ncbi:hypothetical protein HK101_006867, partial [Irineochytrium annulatum]